jgi:hypothetical protein
MSWRGRIDSTEKAAEPRVPATALAAAGERSPHRSMVPSQFPQILGIP